jgi:hypothetical protein
MLLWNPDNEIVPATSKSCPKLADIRKANVGYCLKPSGPVRLK